LALHRSFRRIFAHLAPHRLRVAIGMLCVPASSLLLLWMTQVIGRALDLLQSSGAGGDAALGDRTLQELCLLLGAIVTAEAFARYWARTLLIDASRFAEESLKNELMAHLGRLPVAWFDRARTGDLISRLTQDVELLRFIAGPSLLHGGTALVMVPGALLMMTDLSGAVTAGAGLAFLLLLASLALVLPRLHAHSKAAQEAIAAISQRAAEDFSGIQVVLAFARAREETAAMGALSEDYLQHNMRLSHLRALLDLLIHASRNMVVVAVLILGALEAVAGRLTVGGLFQFLMLIGMLVWPLMAVGWILQYLHRARAAAERIEEIFAVEPEPHAGAQPALRGSIRVENLTFTYPGQPRPALENVSFSLAAGQKLGLVGPPGAGKSTLLALLLRLYEPPAATLFVDGFDVRELAPALLRRTFAVAPQDPFLFSDSIRGNVAFAASGADHRLADAIHEAGLETDVAGFERGLDAIIGERGLTLSGGQKQRVSLARALAADRSVLVLDDTLSAVDHATEARILERMRRARGARTTLAAAHRLSIVRDADLILVLRDGRVIERGTHQELVARGGDYAATWRRQRESDALESQDGGGGDG
jgi:ATP-binding cassette subfamily B protein